MCGKNDSSVTPHGFPMMWSLRAKRAAVVERVPSCRPVELSLRLTRAVECVMMGHWTWVKSA